ncbi:hypothetical protein [Pendulispora albinea]|uniref:Uncharacterized protein n=1 Tax=Pendulispora albinea TaxID=2741071 RepID=A0ABZ2LQY7_9BACT
MSASSPPADFPKHVVRFVQQEPRCDGSFYELVRGKLSRPPPGMDMYVPGGWRNPSARRWRADLRGPGYDRGSAQDRRERHHARIRAGFYVTLALTAGTCALACVKTPWWLLAGIALWFVYVNVRDRYELWIEREAPASRFPEPWGLTWERSIDVAGTVRALVDSDAPLILDWWEHQGRARIVQCAPFAILVGGELFVVRCRTAPLVLARKAAWTETAQGAQSDAARVLSDDIGDRSGWIALVRDGVRIEVAAPIAKRIPSMGDITLKGKVRLPRPPGSEGVTSTLLTDDGMEPVILRVIDEGGSPFR